MATMVAVRKEKSSMTETIDSAGSAGAPAKNNPVLPAKNNYPPPSGNPSPNQESKPMTAKTSVFPLLEHFSFVLLTIVFLGILGFLYFFNRWGWQQLPFGNLNQLSIYTNLAPLMLLAGLIERAVEVVITPWRDPDADEKSSKLAQAKNQAAKPGATSDDQQALADTQSDLNQYTGKTRQYAYAIALILSVCAATAGIRTIWPLVDTSAFKTPAFSAQQIVFVHWFDLLLTTLLLAGGATGLHAPINGFLSWAEKKKQ